MAQFDNGGIGEVTQRWVSFTWGAIRRDRSIVIAAFILAAALLFFCGFQWVVVSRAGFWSDELFALWAGDPGIPFPRAFFERILPDSNAPTYFAFIYAARKLFTDGRVAILWLNGAGLAALLCLLLWLGHRGRTLVMALLAAGFFLTTAPALAYASEGRVYALAMAASLNAAFLAASCLHNARADRQDLAIAAFLGALCAWLHVYGALFCGSLGAALIVVGFLSTRQPDIVRLGIAFSVSTSAAFALWIALAYSMFAKIATSGFWLPFDRAAVVEILWYVKQYGIGWTALAPLGVGFIAASILRRQTRPMALLIAVCGALFITIPFVVSLHIVIIAGRYILVGVPALLVMAMFLVREHWFAARTHAGLQFHRGLGGLGALFLLAPLVSGAPTAWWHFKGRWDWRGIEVIEPLMPKCTERQVRVLNSSMLGQELAGFGYLLRGRLSYINAAKAPLRDVADIHCPVYGWAEHYLPKADRTWVERATVQDALAEFNLTNQSGVPLAIDRHPGGLVLRRTR